MAKLNGQKNYARQKAIEYPFRVNTGQSARRSILFLKILLHKSGFGWLILNES